MALGTCFNPRTPCGVRLDEQRKTVERQGFNPRTPCGVRRPGPPHQPGYYPVSIHALLAECDYHSYLFKNCKRSFNPRTPCGVRRPPQSWQYLTEEVSIHALLAECDEYRPAEGMPVSGFNPRTPCGVRRKDHVNFEVTFQFQSTHSLRSATYNPFQPDYRRIVSIHALLAECDKLGADFRIRGTVSIHALLAECDLRQIFQKRVLVQFQSTHSLRSATRDRTPFIGTEDVSIHALLAECDILSGISKKRWSVSIHALLAECDNKHLQQKLDDTVSIHALLAECDLKTAQSKETSMWFQSTHSLRSATLSPYRPGCGMTRFNPRTPCGVRLIIGLIFQYGYSFNPRTPCGVRPLMSMRSRLYSPVSIHALLAECDYKQVRNRAVFLVSIHALLAECDEYRPAEGMPVSGFNPRTPCGVRHLYRQRQYQHQRVSIHALLAECDRHHGKGGKKKKCFNPRTPCGVRPVGAYFGSLMTGFQSTHSLRSATPM